MNTCGWSPERRRQSRFSSRVASRSTSALCKGNDLMSSIGTGGRSRGVSIDTGTRRLSGNVPLRNLISAGRSSSVRLPLLGIRQEGSPTEAPPRMSPGRAGRGTLSRLDLGRVVRVDIAALNLASQIVRQVTCGLPVRRMMAKTYTYFAHRRSTPTRELNWPHADSHMTLRLSILGP